MSSPPNDQLEQPNAEYGFRQAFMRLKQGKPERLPKGTPVSQNNVAKEAGRDPSALRKSRYPGLVEEIQRWLTGNASDASPPSARQKMLSQRRRNRTLKDKILDLTNERDHAMSLLIEADAKIVDLINENARLQALLPPSNVTSLQVELLPGSLH